MLRSDLAEQDQITVGELVAEYIDDCRIRNLSQQTTHWYSCRLQSLLADHWQTPLCNLRLDDIKRLLAAMLEHRAASTVNGYMRCLKAMLNYALDSDYRLGFSPRKLRKAREPKKIPPCFTMEQVQALLQQPDRKTFLGLRDYTMMCLMLDVGLRLSELTGLRTGDLNLPYLKVYGKGSKERILAMSDVMVQTMRKYVRRLQSVVRHSGVDTDVLFPSRHGGELSAKRVDDVLKHYGQSAGVSGVRVSAHTFRFTYTSAAIRNGMPLTSLQTCLGHTTLAMTRHYVVINDTDAFEDSRRCSPLAKTIGRRR